MNSTDLDSRGVIVACPHCGKSNRLAYERLAQTARCAECRTELKIPGEPIEVTDEGAFDALTGRAALPVLVDFWAPWCGPCKMMTPEIEKAARAAAGRWLIAKLNTEELPGPARRLGVSAIPLLVLFNGGREIARDAGARPSAAIQQFVEQHV